MSSKTTDPQKGAEPAKGKITSLLSRIIARRGSKASDPSKEQFLKSLEKRNRLEAKNRERELKRKSSTQSCLYYENMFEGGMCQISDREWSKTILVSDINYQPASKDTQISLFSRYAEILNMLHHEMPMQVTLRSKRRLEDPLASLYLKDEGDGLDGNRHEINELLHDRIMEGENSFLRDKYFTLTVKADSVDAARTSLNRSIVTLMMHLQRMGCEVRELSGLERLKLIHEEVRPDTRFVFSYDDILYSRLTTKDIIAPDSIRFSTSTYSLNDTHECQVLFLRNLPSQLSDRLLTELLDLPFDITVSAHICAMEHNDALSLVKRKIAYMDAQTIEEQRKAIKAGYDPSMIPHELEFSREEAKNMLESMEKDDQRLFEFSLYVKLQEKDMETLTDHVKSVQDVARKNNCEFSKINFDQENALNSVLPLGKSFLPFSRTLPTTSVAVIMPFTAQDLFDLTGNYCGINAYTSNLVLFDRRLLKSKNMVILGIPGSGKSFGVKKDMYFNFFNDPDSEIIVLDPEREYTNLVEALGGVVIKIAPGADTYINPMDITDYYDDEGAPIDLKISFIQSFFETICGRRLSAAQTSIIDRAARMSYKDFYSGRNQKVPTLKDFYNVLKGQSEAEAANLALILEVYVDGSLSLFSHHTNVSMNKRVTCFDLKGLTGPIKSLGMLVVLDQIWNQVSRNRVKGKRTWIYIDEVQLLLEREETVSYFTALNSRGRKWGVGVTTVTQNAQNLLENLNARTIFSNAGALMLFNQASTDLEDLRLVLKLDDEQLSFVGGASTPGQGLIIIGDTQIPFTDSIPKSTKMYSLMTSKPEEYAYRHEAHE